ncbi:MAG: sialate O-acetylesterase [Rhodoblastus sp.]
MLDRALAALRRGLVFGEPLTPLGDGLIANGCCDRVVAVADRGDPSAISPVGALATDAGRDDRLLAKRYKPTAIIWHQGESDSAPATSAQDYKRDFDTVAARLRGGLPDTPILVSVATKCLPMFLGWRADNAISSRRNASWSIPRAAFLRGVDTDALFGDADRSDACRRRRAGRTFAAAYAALIASCRRGRHEHRLEPFRASAAAPAR